MFDFTPTNAAQAFQVIQKLQAAGYIAYLAGGCVRDALLGREPKDFDVATDATPEMVREVFGRRRTLAFGASFGVIGVLGDASTPTEVATFRSDGEYSDGRRPDSVRFGTPEHDALRRDFTMNGMFYNPTAAELIDFVGGEADLKQRLIRAIGDPQLRFAEDKLRMLRAVRFAAVLGFTIEPTTQAAVHEAASQVIVVSGERIGAELRRMLGSSGAALAIDWLFATGLVRYVWPRLYMAAEADSRLFEELKLLLNHITRPSFVVAVASTLLRIGINRPTALDEIAIAWKLSCDEQRAIQASTLHFDVLLRADQLPWSSVQPIVALREAEAIIATAEAWAESFNQPTAGVKLCNDRYRLPREQLDPPPLLSGDTLLRLGYKPGPIFRDVLQRVRDQQLDQIINSEAEAVAIAQAMLDDGLMN